MSRGMTRGLLTAGAIVASAVAGGWAVQAQAPAPAPAAAAQSWTNYKPTNDLPNPYTTIENYFKLGRPSGSTSAVEIDKDGKTIWFAERCGTNSCANTPEIDTVYHFAADGSLIKSFGKGLIIFPHGIHVDKDGNVWVTDGQDNGAQMSGGGRAAGGGGAAGGGAAAGGGGGRGPAPTAPNPAATKGHQIFKFSPNGEVLMTIGKPGGATGPTECCWQPNDVITNAAGEIFVAEGHGQNPNDRIIKFDKNGKFLQAWGKRGTGELEFNQPHALAFDSQGRLFVGDRGNNRIVVFDKNMKQVADWPQFSRPSGIYIDKKDNLYSADSESGGINPAHGQWKRGIRIGSAKDGKVTALIPDPLELCAQGQQPGNPPTCASGTWVAEGVAADDAGNIYGAEVGPRKMQKYVKK
jgi:streptogramin lyase